MNGTTQHSDAAAFKDRRGGLIAFGVIQILLGSLCALMVPFMAVVMFAAIGLEGEEAESLSAGAIVPGILFYVGAAVWFIWMGIGSVMARRWARALVLVTSWLWLVGGAMGVVCMAFLMPQMLSQMGEAEGMTGGVEIVFEVVMFGFMTVFYVALPAAFVLFYGSRHVKATCESVDARVRWTDRCPLPVLAISLVAGLWALCLPLMGIVGWAVPFFGVVLGGLPAAAAIVGSAALLVYVAWGACRLRVAAWWSAVGLVMAWGLSSAVTFSRVGLIEFYEKMNLPAESLDLMRTFSPRMDRWMVISMVVWVAALLGYLAFAKRFFDAPSPAPATRP
jgi:hypothetical protein